MSIEDLWNTVTTPAEPLACEVITAEKLIEMYNKLPESHKKSLVMSSPLTRAIRVFGLSYNFVINWGDGTKETITDSTTYTYNIFKNKIVINCDGRVAVERR